jgi:hypothetical protein
MGFGLIAGLRFEPIWREGERELSGVLAFVQPKIEGHLYRRWLTYTLTMELARGDAYLRDANVGVAPWEELGARFGKQGTPLSRHEAFSQAQIFFPEYARVAGYFWSGRQKGLTLFGSAFEARLDYFLGVYGSAPLRDPLNHPEDYFAELRISASPLGPINENEFPFTPEGGALPTRVSFTLQGYHGNIDTSLADRHPSRDLVTPQLGDASPQATTVGGDLWLQSGSLIVFGEYFGRRVADDGEVAGYYSQGWWGQAIVDVYRHVIGAGVRIDYLDPRLDLDDDRALGIEGQLAWFIHAPELVLKARYGYLRQDSPQPTALAEFELPFAVGTSHLFTLQLTLGI